MNKEKALKNQGLEFREDIILRGGILFLSICYNYSNDFKWY